MDILIFFYNILIMSAFVFCAVDFWVLYSRRKDKRLLYIAIVFFLFILDNLLLYMNEFLPEFSRYYEIILNTQPYIANILSMVICFSYRMVFIAYREKPMTSTEIILWYMALFVQFIASLAYSFIWGKIISILAFNGLAVGVFAAALYHIKKHGPFPPSAFAPKLHLWFIISAMLLELMCSIERALAEFGIELLHDRFISIELISILFSCSAIAFIIREFTQAPPPEAPRVNDEENTLQDFEDFCEQFSLTPRERDVLIYLILGYSNAEICEEACIAPGTVKSHTHNIYQKLDVCNRLSLMAKLNEFSRSK